MENEGNLNVAGSWSLTEEVNLLEAIVICGQDWIAISKHCVGRSPDECERHYYSYFIDNPRLIDLSNLLKKTREECYNSRKFLCQGLLSDSVCACGETECDASSLLNPKTIKQENNSSNMGAFEKICDSVETCMNNGLLNNTITLNKYDKCGNSSTSISDSEGFSIFNFHPADFHCSDSTCELDECEKLLTTRPQFQNSDVKQIKTEVEFDCDPTFCPEVSAVNHLRTSSSTINSCRLNNSLSDCSFSDKNHIKLETDSVSDLTEGCSSDTKPIETKVFEAADINPDNERSSTNGVNCPQESSANNSKFHGPRVGFDANRTEFDVEFDNGAEETLNLLRYELLVETPDDDVDRSLVTELSLSIVEGYMHRLKERHRRKSLVQRFGLLDYSRIANYIKTVETTFGKRFAKRLVLLKRLFSSKEYDDFMKGYQRLNQLKNNLSTLCNYRERGITTLAAGNLYEEMSKMRNESNKQIQTIPVVRRLENGESVLGSTFRRPAPPIAVHEMPGYESLDKEEIDFCSIQRIAPKSFLEYKNTLINECKKRKCLKLAHARPLLKIDVNKTRKLYDLLLNKNLIWKDEKMTDQ